MVTCVLAISKTVLVIQHLEDMLLNLAMMADCKLVRTILLMEFILKMVFSIMKTEASNLFNEIK